MVCCRVRLGLVSAWLVHTLSSVVTGMGLTSTSF